MAELTYSVLKNSHQLREQEEKRVQERKRNLMYLILQYLKDEGYTDTASTLINEGQLTNSYQICDNVDLPLIYLDFENYYYVRFQRYPKICKKSLPSEEINKPGHVKPTKFQTRRSESKVRPKSPASFKVQGNPPEKPPEIKCLSVTQLGPPNAAPQGQPSKPEKTLKPLGGMGIHNTDWMHMAELITKDIVLTDLNTRWSDIMGLEEPKRLLKEAVVYPIKYPDLFKGILSPWKGLLLFGPPGTGKTLLAKAVATECNTTFFNITASSIVSKWRGDSEKLVRVMFDLARYHAPSTIFLDELDALASKRDSSPVNQHEASKRLKTELLIQLDGLSHSEDEVFFLATSNLPWELDPAILRRLEKRIMVGLPNAEAREAMFKHYLPEIVLKEPLLKCDVEYEYLAKETEGYSGSDIRLVCKETAMGAIRKVFQILENMGKDANVEKLELQTITTSRVLTALEKTKPAASQLVDKYKLWQDQFGST